MLYKVGDLLWVQHWDESGPMVDSPPVLVVRRYVAMPKIVEDDEMNLSMLTDEFPGDPHPVTVYDILCDGELEERISESWLTSITDSNFVPIKESHIYDD